MAGEGYRTWVPGEVITANNVQGYLQDQTVQVYPDAATRDTTLIGFLAEGMLSYLEDTNSVEVYDGSAWVGLGGDAPIFTAGSAGQFLKSLGTAGVDWDDVPIPASAQPTVEGIVFARQAGTVATDALTAFGYEAGPLDYDGTGFKRGSTYIGFQAGKNATRIDNTAVGHEALRETTTGATNTAVGRQALVANTTGINNTGIGEGAFRISTTAGFNTGVGASVFNTLASGNQNTGIGFGAGAAFSSGAFNSVVGSFAGASVDSSGSNNTIVGAEGAFGQAVNGSNNTMLGYRARASSASANNEITLGNDSIATIRAQVTSITSLSDERDKTNVDDLEHGLDFVNQLRPVSFDWWQRKPEPVELLDGTFYEVNESTLKRGESDIGFIAQDIVALEDALDAHDQLKLSYRSNPDALEVTQGRLIPILVKAIQELSAEVESLKSQLK